MKRPPVTEILADLGHRGAQVRADGDRLRFRAPIGAVSAEVRKTLARHKSDLLAQLHREEWLLSLPLSQFARQDCFLKVSVPGLAEPLWFASGQAEVDTLLSEGIRRGRIWTATELSDLCTDPAPTQKEVVSIARVKLKFSATIVDVRASREE